MPSFEARHILIPRFPFIENEKPSAYTLVVNYARPVVFFPLWCWNQVIRMRRHAPQGKWSPWNCDAYRTERWDGGNVLEWSVLFLVTALARFDSLSMEHGTICFCFDISMFGWTVKKTVKDFKSEQKKPWRIPPLLTNSVSTHHLPAHVLYLFTMALDPDVSSNYCILWCLSNNVKWLVCWMVA